MDAVGDATGAFGEGIGAVGGGTDAFDDGIDAMADGIRAFAECAGAVIDGVNAANRGGPKSFELKAGDEERRTLTGCSRGGLFAERIFFRMMRACIRPPSQQRPSWVAPVRRLRRAVCGALRALEESRRRLEESERRHVRQPRAAALCLRRANHSLRHAAGHLGRASLRMGDAMQALAFAPHGISGAPAAIIELTQRFLNVAGGVAHTSNRIERTLDMIRASLESRGAGIPDAIEPAEVAQWGLMVTRRFTRPWLLDLDLPSLRETVAQFLFPRRRRVSPPAVVDGVRRICRGRAPPRWSTCTL